MHVPSLSCWVAAPWVAAVVVVARHQVHRVVVRPASPRLKAPREANLLVKASNVTRPVAAGRRQVRKAAPQVVLLHHASLHLGKVRHGACLVNRPDGA